MRWKDEGGVSWAEGKCPAGSSLHTRDRLGQWVDDSRQEGTFTSHAKPWTPLKPPDACEGPDPSSAASMTTGCP